MQFTKVPVKHFNEAMDVLFITLDRSDRILYSSLMSNDSEERHQVISFITDSAIEIYEINAESESVSFGMFGKEDAYITVVPDKHLNSDELTSLSKKILPSVLNLPIWMEITEMELILYTVERENDNDFWEEDEYDEEFEEQNYVTTDFHTYKIPSLSSLLNFTTLSGIVVEKDSVLYLQTSNDMSEFFDELPSPIQNATVVVPNIEKMIQKIKSEDQLER